MLHSRSQTEDNFVEGIPTQQASRFALFFLHHHQFVVTGDGGTRIHNCLKQIPFTTYGTDSGKVRSEIHSCLTLHMAGDAQGLARVVEKFLPANGISLGQETGKVIEAFSLAGLLGRIGFHGISQLDDRHDVR